MVKGLLKRIFGDPNDRIIARLQKTAQLITELEATYQHYSAEEVTATTGKLRARLEAGETLDDLLPEAFAVVREASQRTIGLRHYDVQLIGGMLLHQGEVVEMRTGEGKTLVATLPLYLNALVGQGAHLVTPNDYLAKVGVQWMGPIYHALGISVSVIQSGAGRPDDASFLYDPDYASDDDRYQYLRPITRREAYRADITYGTNNEFGFDYLRDNMVISPEQRTQRPLHYAIVDEVDSILIDEARTPLIISGPAEASSDLYQQFARLVRDLHSESDYEVDLRAQTAILTEEGVTHVESMLAIPEGESIYDSQHAHMLAYLDNALRAKEFFQRDKEYVIRDGEIIIVDQFTGRLMFGRRYSEGLHQAIEAKENVEVRRESLTYATITFQNFFRMYGKLAGMTGTAETEKEELRKIYNLDVVVLPTNVEYRARYGNLETRDIPPEESGVAFAGVLGENHNYAVTVYDGSDGNEERYYKRLDMPDQIYKSERAKFDAVVEEIARLHQARRPVLVGTTAIETSEHLARLLSRRRIPHEVLNAKYHEKEAVIIAQAGQPGAVTIATNMAGRGVDILLGGNPEGMARDALRREGVDLTAISSAAWEDAIHKARTGEDPTPQYPERWAEVLYQKIRECQADRARVYNLGGLHVIGTERHEARRIDNQLRGRAGRQGDPGSSRFYISLEDELMRRFGGERLQPWMERAGLEDAPLEFNVLAKAIASIQERVEGYNFDIRKHVLEYDNVVNKQREVVYAERNKIMERADLHDDLMEMVADEVRRATTTHRVEDNGGGVDTTGLLAELRTFLPLPRNFSEEMLVDGEDTEAIVAQMSEVAEAAYWKLNEWWGEQIYQSLLQQELSLKQLSEKSDPFSRTLSHRLTATLPEPEREEHWERPLRRLPDEVAAQVEETARDTARLYRDRELILRQIDNHWVRHLTDLDILREGIGLRAVGQQNPLVAYQKEAFEMYQGMMSSVKEQVVRALFLAPQASPQSRGSSSRARAPRVRLSHPRPQLKFQAAKPEQAAETAPQPHRSGNKPGRNDPCWCGSGKKYKDCHLRQDQREMRQAVRGQS